MNKLKKYYNWISIFIKFSTFKKIINIIVTIIMIIFRKKYANNYPIVVYIEPTNICNLNCPGCPTGLNISSKRKKSFLSFNVFEIFINEIRDFVYSINFSNWGEPLLHPEIYKMIKYANKNKIRTCLDTNLNIKMNYINIKKIITSGLDLITISMDGYSQNSYSKYRIGGNLDLLKKNIKQISKMKKKLNKKNPIIEIQFLKFKHNENEIELVNEFAKKNNANFIFKSSKKPSEDYDINLNEKYDPKYPACIFLWTITTLNSDGGLSPCCQTYYKKDDFGVIKNQFNFKKYWNNRKYMYSRSLFSREFTKIISFHKKSKNSKEKIYTPCKKCSFYTKKVKKYGVMGII